ncbi:MAG: AEC family transporter [Flavonifractor plautii]
MLENLAYCLNATAPIFLLMLLGLVFRRLGFFSQAFADKLNDFVFKVGLPVMLFKDLVESDFFTVWDGPFVLFCFLATLGSILLTAALSLFCRERPLRGEFIQVGYRSSIALLGAAFLENLYGTAGAASLVIIGAVPPLHGGGDGALPHQSPAERPQPGRVKESPQGYCHEPHHPGYRRRSGVDAAGHPPASDSAKTVSSLSATATPWASWPWAPPSI